MRQRIYDEDGARHEKGKKQTSIVRGKPKTSKSIRQIPLQEPLLSGIKCIKELKTRIEIKAWELWRKKLLAVFHNLLGKAGLSMRGIHSLRHTFATRAIETGMDIKTLSELLGNEDKTTTLNLYVHSSDDAKREQVKKLENLLRSIG